MLNTLTNINCEMKSMAVYMASIAMVIPFTACFNEFSSSVTTVTAPWEFENQLNAAHIEGHDT